MQNWIKFNDRKQLPVWKWLVKHTQKNYPYGVASCVLNGEGNKIITLGALFSWEAGEIESYSDFARHDLA